MKLIDNRFWRWSSPILCLVILALLPGTAMPQDALMLIGGATVFEGNSGTKIMSFPVTFLSPQPSPVTGRVSVGVTGIGSNAATPGDRCTSGSDVDFESFTNTFGPIPANTTTPLSVNVVICGDTALEEDERISVFLTDLVGASCGTDPCGAIGTIVNDDGPPSISINNVSVSEPVLRGSSRNATFTVSLHHPSEFDTSVDFSTRNGTAVGGPCGVFLAKGGFSDYAISSGPMPPIPAGSLSGTLTVPICGDQIAEANQTFFVDLSIPSGTFATIADGVGQGTIRDTTLTIGGFDLSPDDARVRVGEMLSYTVVWTVPEGEVWRDLNTIDFRVSGCNKIPFWVRWDEPNNTLSLCSFDGDNDNALICGPGGLPGSPVVLETPFARLHLAESSIVGSGPTAPSVTLTLGVSFREACGLCSVELAATDDSGNEDDFVVASELQIRGAGPSPHEAKPQPQ